MIWTKNCYYPKKGKIKLCKITFYKMFDFHLRGEIKKH